MSQNPDPWVCSECAVKKGAMINRLGDKVSWHKCDNCGDYRAVQPMSEWKAGPEDGAWKTRLEE
jgi:hypothetical protein